MNNLTVIEREGQRVLTTEQLAQVYETDVNNIKNNFNRNKDKFKENIHYYLLKGENLKEFKNYVTTSDLVDKHTPQLYLWTLRGASRHCKILDTDKAWQQFDVLEESYFQPKVQLPLPISYKEALKQLIIELEEKEGLKTRLTQQEQIITELNPKATYYDLVLQCKDLLSATQIAKDYGKSARWLNKILSDEKIQFKQSGEWILYKKYAERGYTQSKTHDYSDNIGILHTKLHTYWTQKGRLFIYELLKDKGILPIIERERESA